MKNTQGLHLLWLLAIFALAVLSPLVSLLVPKG